MFKRFQQHLGAKPSQNILPSKETDENLGIKMDIPGSLPIEIFEEIFMYLSSDDLQNTWKCCQKWRSNMESLGNSFWERKCKIEGYFECEDDLNSSVYRKFLERYSQWQGIYMYNSILESNWIKQNYKEVVVQCKWNEIVPSCSELKYFSGDVVIVVLKSKYILVIDCTTGFVKNRFHIPQATVKTVELLYSENRLIVAVAMNTGMRTNRDLPEYDKIHILGWNVETGESLTEFQIDRLECHFSRMTMIQIYKDLVMVRYGWEKLYIINIKKKQIDFQMDNISSVCQYEDKIATGSYDSAIGIMNLRYTELMVFKKCFKSSIDSIQITGNYLIGLTTLLEQACVINIETKAKLYQIEPLLMAELRIYLTQNMLVYLSPSEDSLHATLKCCHLDSGECILDYYEDSINSTTHDFFVIHQSSKGSLKLRSIKSKNIVSDLVLPISRNKNTQLTKSKSKLAYFDTGITNSFKCRLKIVNFEATMEI